MPSDPTLLPGERVAVVTATATVRKICPYVDECDHGEVTVSWSPQGATVELHSLAEWLTGFSERRVSHEALTAEVADHLEGIGLADVRVTSKWRTAGLTVEVTR